MSLVWKELPAWIVSLKGVPCSFEYEPKHCKVAVDLVVIDDRARTVIEVVLSDNPYPKDVQACRTEGMPGSWRLSK
jgi:hypothetical protein